MPTTAADESGGPRLATERLRLRPVSDADVAVIAELADDPEVAGRTGSIPYPLSEDEAQAWFRSHLGEEGETLFAIERTEDGAFLGVIGLGVAPGARRGSVGFWLARPHWGRGYMTEAVAAVLAHAFAAMGLDAVEAEVFNDNAASLRVLEKAGFRWVGVAERDFPARGGRRKVVRLERRRPVAP
jgi:8-oxo-dGTP diphosphatase